MSWTYSADPTSSPKDAVRYLIADTNPDNPIVQDEEIYFCLAEVSNNIYKAASNACIAISGLFTSQAESVSRTIGGLELSTSYRDRASKYLQLATALLLRGTRVSPPMVSANTDSTGNTFAINGPFDPYLILNNPWGHYSTLGVPYTDAGTNDRDYQEE